MLFHRPRRQVQPGGDVLVRQMLADQLEDLGLPGGDAETKQVRCERGVAAAAPPGGRRPGLGQQAAAGAGDPGQPTGHEHRFGVAQPGHRIPEGVCQRGLCGQPQGDRPE